MDLSVKVQQCLAYLNRVPRNLHAPNITINKNPTVSVTFRNKCLAEIERLLTNITLHRFEKVSDSILNDAVAAMY